MDRLSVLIPSYRDPNLKKTIERILIASKEDIEIIVYLDGFLPGIELIQDNRILYIMSEDNVGMRYAINECAKKATGKYIIKFDSHCDICDGFDVQMKYDNNPKQIQIPSRYHLNIETWDKFNGPIDYVYLKFPKDIKTEFGFRTRLFKEKQERKDNPMIDDIIIFQGSCWFMEKDFFYEIGGLNEKMFGSWGMEAQELSMKTWLCNDGCVVRNRNVWYAHYKKKIQKNSMRKNMLKNMNIVFNMCLNNKWPDQNKTFEWLVNKIGPFPGWPRDWNRRNKWM